MDDLQTEKDESEGKESRKKERLSMAGKNT